MAKFFADPRVRLVVRAILAGVGIFVSRLQAADALDVAVIEGAAVAAGWAIIEAITPLNALIGFWRIKQ